MLRQPIVSILGNVDVGKTTLLDRIRSSIEAEKEAGNITQSIGATDVPIKKIKDICGGLIEENGIDLRIPGFLFIDTPGHAAFISLRKRGGTLSDICILVIDINSGVQPQTIEAIKSLKKNETPFVIALNKVDRLGGWKNEDKCFVNNYQKQDKRIQEKIDNKIYNLMSDFNDYGFTVDRYDRIDDFRKKIAIVPMSAETGEGVPELLTVIGGISQSYLKEELKISSKIGKGTVLEVNETKGLGKTIDVILYDGTIHKEDTLIIGGRDKITETEIKVLMKPKPLSEIRTENQFDRIEQATPAAGVRICGKEMSDVIAGAPIRAIKDKEKIEQVKEEISQELAELEIDKEKKGIVVKSNSIGGLEAIANMMKEENIPIKKAEVGSVNRSDVALVENEEKDHKAIFSFNTDLTDAAERIISDKDVKLFQSDVIYQIIDDYKEWKEYLAKKEREEKLEKVNRAGKIRIMPDHVFRKAKPAVVGVEVVKGSIKPGSYLIKENGDKIGKIKSIQKKQESVDLAQKGEEVAVSITSATVGRQIEINDYLYTDLKGEDYHLLKDMGDIVSDDELDLLDKIDQIKSETDPRWKLP